MDHFHIALSDDQLRAVSSIGLAHVGDAVYELLVRTWLCAHGRAICTAPPLHWSAHRSRPAGPSVSCRC